ncbi:MAG: EscU/YscU/HrcU family type III secretion system export apparatus switch protein [Myxococcales bacterium]|nr:EscU/YscU/HrcU family type III secretion system export apparatus switch protein [Myxococcales bacterium]
MAEQDKSERTEDATPRRQEKLREEGKVAKSADVGAAGVLAAAFALLALRAPDIGEEVVSFAGRSFRLHDSGQPLAALGAALPVLAGAVVPILLAAALAAIVTGIAQTGAMVNLSLVLPKAERLNPGPQLGRMIPGKESGLEILKQMAKMAAIGAVIWFAIEDSFPMFAGLAAVDTRWAASSVGSVVGKAALFGTMAFALIAAWDLLLARRRFADEAKMSRRDVRDEYKEEQGDPQILGRRRQRQRELAGARFDGDLSQATVLVVNPTHVSVALRYDPERDAAPIALAKGLDAQALEMRAMARKYGIAIVENRPLARALHREAKLGEPIPMAHFGAAAEIIAHVMRLGRANR